MGKLWQAIIIADNYLKDISLKNYDIRHIYYSM